MASIQSSVSELGFAEFDVKPQPRKALKIVDVVLIGALTFGLTFLFGFSYSIYLGTQGYDAQEILGHLDLPEGQTSAITLGLVALFVGPIVFVSFFAWLRGLRMTDFGICRSERRYFYHAAVGLIVLSSGGVWLETFLDAATIELLDDANNVLLAPEGVMLFVSLALVVLLVPFGEELFFRVALYDALAARMPPLAAALLGTSVYTLVHTQYLMLGGLAASVGLFQIFMLGGILTWLYARSRSIWPSFMLHAVNNAIAFSVIIWLT